MKEKRSKRKAAPPADAVTPNRDDVTNFNFTTTGDGSEWDSGRRSSIAEGTRGENDMRAADSETPGVNTRKSDVPEE